MRIDHVIRITAALGMLLLVESLHAGALAAAASPAEKEQLRRTHVAEDSGIWRRDPFGIPGATKNVKLRDGRTPPVSIKTEQEQQPELNIQGIMLADKTFHALINGRVVKAGDKVDGVTISEISRYQVTVQDKNKKKSVYDIYQGRIDRGKNEK